MTEILRQLTPARHRMVAAVVHSPRKAGKDLGELTLGEPLGIRATAALEDAVTAGEVDVLLYGGLIGETLERVMRFCADAGVDLIHACFVHPRMGLAGDVRADVQASAERSGARILGTGVLPGMLLDVLPAVLASCLPDPVRVVGRVVSDPSSWGVDVLRHELGVGDSRGGVAARYDAILRECAQELVDALALDDAELRTEGGLHVARAPVRAGPIEVAVGEVEGFDQRVVARVAGEDVIDLGWVALPDVERRGLRRGTELSLAGGDGEPLKMSAKLPADPYPATAARMLKSIDPLRRLPAGLHLPASLAVA